MQTSLLIVSNSRETHRNAGFIHRYEYLGDESPEAAAPFYCVYWIMLAALDRHIKDASRQQGSVIQSTELHLTILRQPLIRYNFIHFSLGPTFSGGPNWFRPSFIDFFCVLS